MKTNDYNFFVKNFGRIGRILLLTLIMNFGFSLAKATDIPAPTAFGVLDASDGLADDVYNVAGDLHILAGGSITGPGGAFGIKINVTGNLITDIGGSIDGNVSGANLAGITIDVNVSGDIILHGNGTTGASITSDQIASSCSGSIGHGGNITLIAGGNITTEAGTKITSDSRCSAGFIYIRAAGIVVINGLVESHAALSGTGANQNPGGGPVTIIGGNSLTINDSAVVSSRGQDPGADLVHLEACEVTIYGLVQSTGVGHALPDDSVTHVVPPYRPEKDPNSTAGVEVWAGSITINSVPPHKGEVKADLTSGEGSIGWIDLFAQNDINIIGDITGNFAVHANNGGAQNQGGFISVKSVSTIINATGRAFQANGAFGGSGGVISLEANNKLTLSGAEFDEATGVSNDGGALILKSFNDSISSTSAVVINVTAPTPGTVTRTACLGIGAATIIPNTVVPSDNLFCGGSPAIFPEDSLPEPCTVPPVCDNVTISGPSPVCPNSSGNIYTASISGACANITHHWTISGSGTIVGSSTGSSITVTAGLCGQFVICDTITCDEGQVTCCRTIDVVDTDAPVITCPTVSDVECPNTPNFGSATASDLCDQSVVPTSSDVSTPGSCPQEYSITRTWTATDECNNSSTCSRTISVTDNTAPDITCPTVSDVECPNAPNFGSATATDLCDPNVEPTSSDVSTPGNCPQEYSITRTWTATDDCLNSSTCSRTINVTDNTAPDITCPPVSDVECPNTPNFGSATASDLCDPSVVPTSSDVSTPGNCPQEYSITRTWTATDDCSNSSTCSRTINVTDNTAPDITCPPVSDVECPGTPNFGSATASDLCDPSVVPTSSDVSTPGNCPQEYSITRTWTSFTDDCSNSSTCSRTINVTDNTAPTITCPTVISPLDCPGSPNFGDATATDLCDPTVVPTFSDVTSPGCEGGITRTWTATDDCNNSSTCSRTIVVNDNTAPDITCPTVSDVECPNAPDFGSATATDLCDPSVIPTSSDVSTPGSCPQEYSITRTWTATDDCSNSSTCSRTINVTDNTAPAITCPNPASTVECPNTPYFGSATASDLCDPSVVPTFSNVTTPGSCPQEYSITRTWTATDDCSNSSTCSRTINVTDNTAPTITCPNPASSVECPNTPNFGSASATDLCDPSVVPTSSDVSTPGSCPQEYSITRTWTATDDCSNSSTCSRTISVTDNTSPTITCPSVSNVECPGTPNFGSATANDVCDPSVIPTFSNVTTPGTCPQEYSVTRTWTATDDCLNSSTCSRTISVTDDTAPVISCPPNMQINGLGTETGAGCVDFGGGGVATVNPNLGHVPNSKVGVDFRQPRNQGHPTTPLNWTNGINCLTQSEYFEGMGVPQRIILTGLKGNSHTLRFRHEAVKHQSGDRHAYDFMMSWPQAIATAGAIGNGTLNELLNLNPQTCNNGISNDASPVCSAFSLLFPPNTRIATANLPDTMGNPPNHHGTANVNNVIACFEAIYGNRTIEMRGSTAITAFSITFDGYSGTATGDNYAWYTISWTSTSQNVMIKLAGRPAASQGACGYGNCFGAANISGGPYHFKLDLLDGASMGDRDNQVMVTTPLCNVEIPVTFGTPTATDACDQTPQIDIILLDSISYDAQGAKTHCRKWRATDDCNNSSQCMQCIRVFCGTANRVEGGETSSDEPLFTAYPNPTSGNATVVFRAPSDCRAVMDVYDVTGALVSRVFNGDVSEGVSYSLDVNSSLWSEGIYFIRLSLGDEAAVSKLVVMKE